MREDQIVVIEHRALALHPPVFLEHGERDSDHRLGQRGGDRRPPALLHPLHASAQLLQPRCERRVFVRQCLGDRVCRSSLLW